MKHFWPATFISSLAPLTILACTAHAQTTLPAIPVWSAQATSAARVGAWGNGSAEATQDRSGTTLRVAVRNFHEGARFDLAKPIDLAPYRQSGFWRIRVQTSGSSQRGGSRRTGRTRGATAQPQEAPLTQLRLKLMLEQGAMSGLIQLGQASRGGDGWQTLLLPIRSMSATSGAKGSVQRIILTGNSVATFNVEQISLVAETDRITASVRRATDAPGTDLKTVTLKPGRGTTLVADVDGGTSDVIATWNFDADNSGSYPLPIARGGRGGAQPGALQRGGRAGAPGSAGIAGAVPGRRVDAVGLSAQPNWPNEEQDYRVEVIVSDRSGRKPPVRKSFKVEVRG